MSKQIKAPKMDIGKWHRTQQSAIDAMSSNAILAKWGNFRFGSFPDQECFLDFIDDCEEQDRQFYEVLQDGKPQMMFADLDGEGLRIDKPTIITQWNQLLTSAFEAAGLEAYNPKYVRLTQADGNKISFHWIYLKDIFKNCDDQKLFWKYVDSIIESSYPDLCYTYAREDGKVELRTIVDISVYTKNRAMRTIYSSKGTDQKRFFKPVSQSLKVLKRVNPMEYLIAREEEGHSLEFYDIKIPAYTTYKNKFVKLDSIKDIILQSIPNVEIVSLEGRMFKLKNVGTRCCVINGEENLSDNSYVIWRKDGLWFGCHDASCSGQIKHIYKTLNSHSFLDTNNGKKLSEVEVYKKFKIASLDCKTPEQIAAFMEATTDYFNKTHIMIMQAKTYILREKNIMDDDGNDIFELIPSDDKSMMLNYCNMTFNFEGWTRPLSWYETWKSHINRRTASKCVFYPKAFYDKKQNPDVYNLFRGLAIERDSLDDVVRFTEDEIEKEEYFKHIKHRWCAGNQEVYDKVMDFFASILQRPWYKMKFCIVLKSLERSGKGLPIQIFNDLIGSRYFFHPSTAAEMLGAFNANMMNKLLIFMDEMVWGGDKEKAGVIKKLTTEDQLTLRQKYMPDQIVKNCINLIMASNEDWVVPAGTTDTRWLVLNVSNELSQMKDKKKKKKIIDSIQNVDRMKLAKYFYERDISKFNDRETIKTDGLREQQIQSLSKLNKWWLDTLNEGELQLSDGLESFNKNHTKSEVYASYRSHSGDKHTNATKFWRDIKQLCDYKVNGQGRKKVQFQTLEVCKAQWRTIYDDPNWQFDDGGDDSEDSEEGEDMFPDIVRSDDESDF